MQPPSRPPRKRSNRPCLPAISLLTKSTRRSWLSSRPEKERADAAEAERDKLLGAQNRAAWAESHIQDVEAQRDAALADVQGLTEQNAKLKERADSAEAREEEAWKMQSKAEARAHKAEDALKHQPITAVVDEEEVDRRAAEKGVESCGCPQPGIAGRE